MRILWLSDIHLDFLSPEKRWAYYEELDNQKIETIVITGDIANATCTESYLQDMSDMIKSCNKICYVLGNHDFYGSSIKEVADNMHSLVKDHSKLIYLTTSEPIKLDSTTIIIGQDCWADGRYGDYAHTTVRLNDRADIKELSTAWISEKWGGLLKEMQKQARKSRYMLRKQLLQAVRELGLKKILIATHVPLFVTPIRHGDTHTEKYYLPFYTCKTVGGLVRSFAKLNPEIDFQVLSGHTHTAAEKQILPNLNVRVFASEYTKPSFNVLEV